MGTGEAVGLEHMGRNIRGVDGLEGADGAEDDLHGCRGTAKDDEQA
jgi:hypothetical protein